MMKKLLVVPFLATLIGSSMGKLFDNPFPSINVGPCPASSEYPSYKFNTAANIDGTYYLKYYTSDLSMAWSFFKNFIGDLDTSSSGLKLTSTSTGVTYDVVMDGTELGIGGTVDCSGTNVCNFGINDFVFPFTMIYNGNKADGAEIIALKSCYESINDLVAPLEALTGFTVPTAIIIMFNIVS